MPLVTLAEAVVYRGHHRTYAPIHFNRTAGRFASPDGVSFGTLYVGEDAYAAFIEAFGQGLVSSPLGVFASEAWLATRCLCVISATRPLRLVDLSSGSALKRLSAQADGRLADGAHHVSQQWAAALWAHPEQPDGLLYRARNAPDHRSMALFDRVEDVLAAPCSGNLLDDEAQLARILDRFNCALIP
ncbi:MAG: RES family NAD+ phosphorylase [Thermomicrobiales bacterium]|nr:RES family NAD+ phosphorylase [Thermomicrobiales bacterium]